MLTRTRAAAVRSAVPGWLAEVVRPKPAPPPWPAMIRAALAICVPLSAAFAVGKGTLGVLPAMGGLLGTMVDTGGSYRNRLRRVSTAAVFGGAVGLAIGSVIHGHGWLAVLALILVAGVSGILSAVGDVGSITGLQLLVYSSIGIGPLGAQRPVWHLVVGFLLGVAWALLLTLPGWLLSPHETEQRVVAAVYQAVAAELRAVGTGGFTAARQALTAALNRAYDTLITARSTAPGRNPRITRLMAALNSSHQMTEAVTTLGLAGSRPPPPVIDTVQQLADSIRTGAAPPPIPPAWDDSPGALALHDGMADLARVLSADWSRSAAGRRRGDWSRGRVAGPARLRRAKASLQRLAEEFSGGTLSSLFTIRLMACMGVAGVVTEVTPLQRSYWVPLTVAIVFKPDLGSVFARAVQRGVGTIVGAVVGAVLLALVHGIWLLIPLAVLAALLPYGRSRNYGLLSTFLTPLVVILIDLISPAGWRLATDRLIDTLIGCAIVLLIGFAPWPMSWYAHLPAQFARTARDVAAYLEEATSAPPDHGGGAALPQAAWRLRRATYRALSDLRTEFQRTMSEPPAISRRASAWWPAVVALEQAMDAITSVAVAGRRGPPSAQASTVPPEEVRQLAAALRSAGEAAATGTALMASPALPDDEALEPVTSAVRALLGVLDSGERLGARG
ncbi:MAG: FUSC family protein [Streptosporangiaceae bacterium]|nr:FUSC family protein [Streptosporangiaceae bacterium]